MAQLSHSLFNFLKENYHQFKEKMYDLLMHVHDSNQNFNTLMNKREIDRKNTLDNMHQLLTDFEKLRGRCFSFIAFTDHVNARLEPRGRSATTSMWGYVASNSHSKFTFAKLLNESTHIDKMLKLIHVPEEIIRTVEQGEALQRNCDSDAFVITIPIIRPAK